MAHRAASGDKGAHRRCRHQTLGLELADGFLDRAVGQLMLLLEADDSPCLRQAVGGLNRNIASGATSGRPACRNATPTIDRGARRRFDAVWGCLCTRLTLCMKPDLRARMPRLKRGNRPTDSFHDHPAGTQGCPAALDL